MAEAEFYGTNALRALYNQGTQTNYNVMLVNMFAQYLGEGSIRRSRDGSTSWVDAWGNLIRVETRDEAIKRGIQPSVIAENSLVIWSVGPNGKDEGGRGDDIFVPQ